MPYVVIKTKTTHGWRNSRTSNDVICYTRTRFGARWMRFWERLLAPYDPTVEWRIETVHTDAD